MRAYKDYMDGLSVSQEQHNEIMAGLRAPRGRSRSVVRLTAAVACTFVLALSIWLFPLGQQGPRHEISLANGVLYFDELEEISASKRYVPGYFPEGISSEGVTLLFGGKHPVSGSYSVEKAVAGYDKDGSLVDLSVIYGNSKSRVCISMGKDQYITPSMSPKVSSIGGLELTAGFWYTDDSSREELLYVASFYLGGRDFTVTAHSQKILAEVLQAIMENDVDLSSLVPAVIPEWRDDVLNWQEAKDDADFGSHVPSIVPTGFSFSDARRQTGTLSLNYYAGLRYIELKMSKITPDDQVRIVDIHMSETYDLSLYPIPRATTVDRKSVV